MLRRLAKEYPVAVFYLWAFVLGWAGWLPLVAASRCLFPPLAPIFRGLLVLPGVAPLLAAVITRRLAGEEAKREHLLRPFLYQVRVWWYLPALLLPATILLATRLLEKLASLSTVPALPAGNWSAVIGILGLSWLANPWEEVGWRGFALPRLQQRYGPAVASLLIGCLSGLWHVPVFFWPDNPMAAYPFGAWLAGTIGTSFIATWLYNHTAGSLLIVTIFHVALNTWSVLVGIGSFPMYAAVSVFVVIILYGFFAPLCTNTSK